MRIHAVPILTVPILTVPILAVLTLAVPILPVPILAALCLTSSAAVAREASADRVPSQSPEQQRFAGEFRWRMIGPFRGGRTRAVAGVVSQPNVFYVGAVDGGVWKSDDAGRTWQPIFDAQPTQSIGAIAVAPSNPDILYVGSGEGLHRPDLSIGNGIYRSTDAGRSWTHLGLTDAQQIPALAIDPRDPRRLFAAVLGHPYGPNPQRGIYRSLDAGATWQQVLFKDENTGGSAVAIDPERPNIVYAALWQSRLGPWEDKSEYEGTGGGLFKSTDGGSSWRRLTNGLPADTAQINISIAASAPDRLYAEVGTNEPGAYSSAAGLGVFRSDDAGESWSRITTDPRPALRIGGGDLPVIRADPSNADIVYSAGIVTMKSTDGGKTWQPLRGAPGGDDYQNLWINPERPGTIALVSDQGAVVTLNDGRTWSSWFNQPTAQLYHVSISPTFPYRVCAGQQESGSVCILSRGNDGEITERDWHPVGVIEYGYVAPDPLDPDLIYGAGRNVVSKFHWSTGQVQDITPIPVRGTDDRVDRTEPLLFAPLDPHTLYYAANRLYRTRDGGMTWDVISPDLTRADPGIPPSVGALHTPGIEHQRGAIYAIGASSRNAETLWAGTDDGLVWRTGDGGNHWTEVTPPVLSPWSKITQIDASHFDENTAYVSVSRMRLDDLRPYIFRTHDSGRTWTSISDGLPVDAPVNAVREDPERKGLLFAATETSVWMSPDDGAHWQTLQLNLPHTSMRDLWIHGDDLIVATHGRSIWILDDITPLRQMSEERARKPQLLLPAPAYRIQRSTWTDTPIPPDEPSGANPPAGAIIDYFLPRKPRQPVMLEVLDGNGDLVRRFRSDDSLKPDTEELARELIPRYWLALPRQLPADEGMHRWTWDFHYAAPETVARGYPISAVPHATPQEPQGPVALPGKYLIRLTVDGHRMEAPLTLKLDPRVQLPVGALEEQFHLATQLAALLSTSSRALLMAQSEDQQLKSMLTESAAHPADAAHSTGAAAQTTGDAARAIESYDGRLSALLRATEVPGPGAKVEAKTLLPDAQSRVDSLYRQVVRGDAAPTAAQIRAAAAAQEQVAALLTSWQQLQTELPSLNRTLRAAHLQPVRTELPPRRDVNAADED